MRIDPGHCRQKTRIGDAEYADSPVVSRNIGQQPLDRVVGVGALVHAFGIARIVQRAIHDELSLALVPAADILRHEDVAVGSKEPIALRHYGVTLDAVRRAGEQKRQWTLRRIRLAYAGVEMDAVSYRYRHE